MKLYPELWKIILNNLSIIEQQQCRFVCKMFKNIISKPNDIDKYWSETINEIKESERRIMSSYRCKLFELFIKNNQYQDCLKMISNETNKGCLSGYLACSAKYGNKKLVDLLLLTDCKIDEYTICRSIQNKHYELSELLMAHSSSCNWSNVYGILSHCYDSEDEDNHHIWKFVNNKWGEENKLYERSYERSYEGSYEGSYE